MILITGNNGFIGQNLVKRFVNKTIYKSDIDTCFRDLNEDIYWPKVTEIWHMGAISDTTCTDLDKIHNYNVRYSVELFKKAIEHQIPVKYASSASVYGMTSGLTNPLNYYAFSKAIVDNWIIDNLHKFSSIQAYRFFNVYGKNEEQKYLRGQSSPVYSFTKQAKETGKIKLFELSWEYKRDFVWVEDVIDCMLYKRESGIYDLGTSRPKSFQEVAELIAEKYNAKIEYILFPDHLIGKYQKYTCAINDFREHTFTSVEEYLQQQP